MTCQDARDDLEAFVDGALDAERAGAVQAHLGACPDCRRAEEETRSFSAALGEGIRRHVGTIDPPPGAQSALLARFGAAPRPAAGVRFRRLALAAAASVLVGLGAGLAYQARRAGGGGMDGPERAALATRVAELESVRAWQDDLARAVERNPADRPLGLVACAYLPPERGRALLKDRLGVEPTEEAVRAAWPGSPAPPVVRLSRSTRTGTRSSEMLFVQYGDGRVHVEHAERSNGDETRTTLDAASWEILAAQNAELCRSLEIVDNQGRLIAGLPIPSEGQLRRDVAGTLACGAPPRDLAKRLLALRLAPRVKSAEEMERELKTVVAAPPRPAGATPAAPGPLRDAIRRLEAETGADRLPPKEMADARACLDRLRKP
jgi:anti-sigma factor RsiW